MIEFLITGMLLGLASGIAPGPLLALVIGETLKKGAPAGIRVALAPLISDLPIVAATLLLLNKLTITGTLLGAISLAGAAFLLYMSYGSWRASGHLPNAPLRTSNPLLQGVLANLLNPHPYLFWLSVGGGLLGKAFAAGPMMPAVFLLSFYLSLVGSKMLLAILLGRTRTLISEKHLQTIFRLLGLLLFILALDLLHEGFRQLSA